MKQYFQVLSISILFSLCGGSVFARSNSWKTNGNANTGNNASIGTTDSTSLFFKTNSSTRFFIGANGKIGLGTIHPQSKLDIGSGNIRVHDYIGNGTRILAVDSNGIIKPTTIGLKNGGGFNCNPVIDGWGIESPNLSTLRLCGSYSRVQIGNQPITNYNNLGNLLLDIHGDLRVGGDVGFNQLAGGTGLNVVFSDQNGKFVLPPTLGMDPFWATFGTNVQPGMYIGSNNNADVEFRTNNLPRLLISRVGTVLIPILAGIGDEPVLADATGKLVRASNGAYWKTGGNQVVSGQVIGASNNEPLRLITRGADRIYVNPNGEVGINFNPQVRIPVYGDQFQVEAHPHDTWSTITAWARYNDPDRIGIKAVVTRDDTRAIVVHNESLSTNCSNGEDVFRVWGDGRVEAKRIKVFVNGWCDFVFDGDYNLRTLAEVKSYIELNGHLPEVPTTESVTKNGHDLGELDSILLKKIEELTLYAIAQQERYAELEKQVLALNAKLETK